MRNFVSNKWFKFALVGGVGFIADTLIFISCFKLLLLPLFQARLIAFFGAASVTWLGNRVFTFSSHTQNSDHYWRGLVTQWGKFMSSAILSAIPNLIVFKSILLLFGSYGLMPYVALICGVLFGMVSNFILNSRWVFCSR